MGLDKLERTWTTLGEADPLWAVLSDSRFTGRRWDVEAFYATGDREIEEAMASLGRLGLAVPPGGSCLEFGCGVGRCAGALARHVASYHGVDIAPSMLAQARERHPEPRFHFHHVNRNDLRVFADDTFDLVYSRLTLQHIRPDHSLRYIGELMRVLRPGGVARFQVPAGLRPVAPLDDRGYEAELALVSGPLPSLVDRAGRVALLPGDLWNLKVRVRNRSRVRWPPDTVRVGNHWLGPDGQLLCLDDGRAEIPWEMVPGKEAVVSLWTVTPTCPGRHVLELDAVCEGHSWFSQRGSPTCRVPVVVKEGAGRRLRRQAAAIRSLPNRLLGSAGTDVAPPEPPVAYEMHCVPRDDVLAAVGGEGCEITEVMEDGACGPGSVSYVYTVTKPVRAEDS